MIDLQPILNLNQTKLVIKPDSVKKFKLDLNDLGCNSQEIDLVLVLNQGSLCDLWLLGIGQFSLKINLQINLMGIHAVANIHGAFLFTKNSHIKFNVVQNHDTPKAFSKVNIKTVLQDCAQFDYQGKIYIAEHASSTIASQENKNIVLSKDVKVKSVPTIEVLNRDVQCSHGSAIGKIDQNQFIYLISRGLSIDLATKVLISSFLGIDINQ